MRAPFRSRDVIAVLAVATLGIAGSPHVVRSGQTLSGVARDHSTTVRALVSENDIADADLISTGQRLVIPGGPGSSSGSVHVVRADETLLGIALRHDTTVRAIVRANDLSDPDRLRVGQRLTIPAPSGGGSGSPSGSGSDANGRELRGQRHQVRPGETLYGIARRYGIRASDLARWNGIVDGNLYATARLVLYDPGPLPGVEATSGTQTHVVKSGENLSVIALRYGVSTRSIVEANGLRSANRIRVGQRLTIPGSTGPSVQCPVPGASFFNDWGFPRSGGRAHAGNDLFAPRGTPVRAPVSGTVAIATGTIGGHQFRLTDRDGNLWFGSHMDRFGESGSVSAGDIIGYVGDSGNARGGRPHLHFEIHPAGHGAVNPYPLIRELC